MTLLLVPVMTNCSGWLGTCLCERCLPLNTGVFPHKPSCELHGCNSNLVNEANKEHPKKYSTAPVDCSVNHKAHRSGTDTFHK